MGFTTDDLLARLTSPYKIDAGSNNRRFMAAFAAGYWEQIQTNIDDIRAQKTLDGMVGGTIDRWASFLVTRNAGETDSHYKLRIKQKIRRLIGGDTPNEMIEFTAALLGTTPSEIEIIENATVEEPNVYRPAYFTIKFNLDLLTTLGFSTSEYSEIAELIGEMLTTVAAAGFLAEVYVAGGGTYDVAEYDVDTYGP